MSKADTKKLLESKPFAVETIAALEKFVAGTEYDFEIDHALLKLYQFHPSKVNKAVIAQILARALATVPTCDFTQHLYLIPESVQSSDESIATCIAAHDLIERANFVEFWARTTGPLFESANFKKSVRAFITDVVGKTYKAIKTEQYASLVNLSGAELTAHIKELETAGWKQSGDTLSIPSDISTVKPKPTAEVLQFEQFGRILAPLR